MSDPRLLTEPEVAKLLRVCARTIRKLRHDGELPYISLGRKVLYTEADVLDLIERKRVQERPRQPTINISAPARRRKGDEPVGFLAWRKAEKEKRKR